MQKEGQKVLSLKCKSYEGHAMKKDADERVDVFRSQCLVPSFISAFSIVSFPLSSGFPLFPKCNGTHDDVRMNHLVRLETDEPVPSLVVEPPLVMVVQPNPAIGLEVN